MADGADDYVNSSIVVHWLSEAILKATGDSAAEKLDAAWDFLNRTRLDGNCDVSLAAAEHYLYARSLCAKYSVIEGLTIIGIDSIYTFIKLLREAVPSIPEYREGNCPQSRPSTTDWAWTLKGIKDGGIDFGMDLLGLDSVEMPKSL